MLRGKNAFSGDDIVLILLPVTVRCGTEKWQGQLFLVYIVDKDRVDARRFCTGTILHHGVAYRFSVI